MRQHKIIKVVVYIAIVFTIIGLLAGCTEGKNKITWDNQLNGGLQIKIFCQNDKSQPTEEEKIFLEKWESAVNMKLEFELAPSNNYLESLQIMLASKSYPDVIMFLNPFDKVFLDSVDNGVIIPLNKYLDNAPNINKYSYAASWDALKVKGDGNIYAIPRTTIIRADGYVVRQDWLDNVGLSIPDDGIVTLDEFQEILKRFTLNDPDKNGKNDTFGFAASLNDTGYLEPIIVWPFGINGWQKAQGGPYQYMNPIYDRESNQYKDALAYTASLYQKGFIDPDMPLNKRETSIQRFKQGIDGVVYDFAGTMMAYLTDMKQNNPNVKLTYITGIKDRQGDVKCGVGGTGIWGCYGITQKAENPKKILKAFDWLLSDEGWNFVKYGVENVTYTVVDGKAVPNEHMSKYSLPLKFVRRNNDLDFFINSNTPEEQKKEIRHWIEQCESHVILTKDRGYCPPVSYTPAYLDYAKIMSKEVSKIITGDSPVDAYDNLLNGWYQAGGMDYIEQMNEYINKLEKSSKN